MKEMSCNFNECNYHPTKEQTKLKPLRKPKIKCIFCVKILFSCCILISRNNLYSMSSKIRLIVVGKRGMNAINQMVFEERYYFGVS